MALNLASYTLQPRHGFPVPTAARHGQETGFELLERF